MPKPLCLGFLLISLALAGSATAAERQAYKHVDENGNVTYSQIPPTGAKDPKKVDISPANQGRGGGYVQGRSAASYYEELHRPSRSYSSRDQVSTLGSSQSPRDAQLQAECERNRGADCKNADALRQLEYQNIPRGTPRQIAR
jgi:hypothetical protein